MAIATTFKTNVAPARKFYREAPDCRSAGEVEEHDVVWVCVCLCLARALSLCV